MNTTDSTTRPGEAACRDPSLRLAAAASALGAMGLLLPGLPFWLWPLLGAPVLEEIVFRAGLQAWLMEQLDADGGRRGRLLANLLTALAFAAAHVAVRPGVLSVLTLLPALALGALYQRTRRVRHCVALHALFNALWFAVASTGFVIDFTHHWLP